jgi:hypothetical protein
MSNPFDKIKMPTASELEAQREMQIQRDFASPNQFQHWFKAVLKAGVLHPQTKILPLSPEAYNLPMEEDPEKLYASHVYKEIRDWLVSVFDSLNADALFVKNSLFSAKHGWNSTCCLKRDDDPVMHVAAIMYQWAMAGNVYPNALIAREMLDVEPLFYAFDGMPITQEYRVFTKKGRVVALQPYWPEGAIEGHNPSCSNWRDKLALIRKPSDALSTQMVANGEQVVTHLDGDWSIDFLIGRQGEPYLIDMALAEHSYRSEECDAIS